MKVFETVTMQLIITNVTRTGGIVIRVAGVEVAAAFGSRLFSSIEQGVCEALLVEFRCT